jgi:hypothetical protein
MGMKKIKYLGVVVNKYVRDFSLKVKILYYGFVKHSSCGKLGRGA